MYTGKTKAKEHRRNLRRAAVVVQVAVMSTVIVGSGALAIDLGTLYTARGELQRAADAAALAGVSSYFTNAGLLDQNDVLIDLATQRAQEISYVNPTLGAASYLEAADVVVGTFDFDNPGGDLDTSGVQPFNAVGVVVRRTADSFNGPVSYAFARIFGRNDGGVVAEAAAVIDDRFAGFEQREENPLLLPFTIHEDTYEEMLASGPDEWSCEDGEVLQSGDLVSEVKLLPWKQKNQGNGQGGGGEDDGGGNFGHLNVGIHDHGNPRIREQIIGGISPAELEAEIGTSRVVFYDDFGEPVTYEITGTPGMRAGLEDAVEQRIGDIIGFFLHDDIWENGSNATYRIVDIRFGRVMHVDLHGNPNDKQLVVQPVAYTGPFVFVREYAESTDGQVGKLYLVR